MNEYFNVIEAIRVGKLRYPIPTINLKSFFFVREVGGNVFAVNLRARKYRVPEESFVSVVNKISECRDVKKLKFSQREKFAYAILRELRDKKYVSVFGDYKQTNWDEIIGVIDSLRFEDFCEFFKLHLGEIEKSKSKAFVNGQEVNIHFNVKKDSISVYNEKEFLYCFSVQDFLSIKQTITDALYGKLELDRIVESISAQPLFFSFFPVHGHLHNEVYTEFIVDAAISIVTHFVASKYPEYADCISSFSRIIAEFFVTYLKVKIQDRRKMPEYFEAFFEKMVNYNTCKHSNKMYKNAKYGKLTHRKRK